MPRVHFYRPIIDSAGNIVTDATVRISDPETGITTSASLYAAYTGTTTIPNPFSATNGIIDFYLDEPQVVTVHIARPDQPETKIEYIDVGGLMGGGGGDTETLAFTLVGLLSPQVGTLRYYIDQPAEIVAVRASLGSPSSAGDIVLDINRGGTTVYTDQSTRPRLIPGQQTVATTPQVLALTPEDWLTLDVDEAPSGNAATDLVVQIRLRRT